jgi:hypothetical protein
MDHIIVTEIAEEDGLKYYTETFQKKPSADCEV